ncbi:MAG TPA: hypothetical protein PL169_27860, partial [Leptospiraceae bacterium]|nr:hypothetical protein [Leptospiraceae bacterium]
RVQGKAFGVQRKSKSKGLCKSLFLSDHHRHLDTKTLKGLGFSYLDRLGTSLGDRGEAFFEICFYTVPNLQYHPAKVYRLPAQKF